VTNVTLHFLYGGLLCVFLSLWNSYRSLVHRGKDPSPNICVYRQMCDGGVGGVRHLFNLKKFFLSFLQLSFPQRAKFHRTEISRNRCECSLVLDIGKTGLRLRSARSIVREK
jgi:hypothetical protein